MRGVGPTKLERYGEQIPRRDSRNPTTPKQHDASMDDLPLLLRAAPRAMREMVRQFAREEVAPVARKHDADATFPWDNISKMGELGLLGVPWSEELGGAGLDLISFMIAIHELAKVDASHGLTISAHTTLGTSPIVNFGTDEQQRALRAVPRVGKRAGRLRPHRAGRGQRRRRHAHDGRAQGRPLRPQRHRSASSRTAASARSSSSPRSPIRTQGTQGHQLVHPHQADERPRRRDGALGIGHEPSLAPMKGFRAGKKEDKLGWRASDTRELIMEDVEVPAENLLGEEGLGFVNFMQTLDSGRIGIAALSLGIAEGAFEQALRVRESRRKQFGQPIARLPGRAVPALGHGDGDRGGQAPDVSRRVARAEQAAVRQGSGDGEAVLLRARHARDDQPRCRSTAATATPRTIRSSA